MRLINPHQVRSFGSTLSKVDHQILNPGLILKATQQQQECKERNDEW